MVLQRNVGLLSSRVSENQNIDGGSETQACAYIMFLLPVQSNLEEAYKYIYMYVFKKKSFSSALMYVTGR